jgi:error-prone DNA polymerase
VRYDLDSIPKEAPCVYDMLCAADSVGVFQVESRAQMATLPRLRPRRFYDLAVEIGLIRPGPIQGNSVHPYIRRRSGAEPVTYPHPRLEPALARTLGVPLFQEQLMQLAVHVADFTPAEADQLRRAMGSKRSRDKIESMRIRLYDGMAANGITGDTADQIYEKIQAFAAFGFAESHSISFALLVYASSWLKRHHPAAFCAALLNAQPMGFYSPQSLTHDARRHGIEVRKPSLVDSRATATLEDGTGPQQCSCADGPDGPQPAVRLGLASVRGIGDELAERIVACREADGLYTSMSDLARRVGLSAEQLEALATAGAFECFGLNTRQALWAAGPAAEERPEYLPHTTISVQPPLLPEPTAMDRVAADLWATGISPDDHPVQHVRPDLDRRGVLSAAALRRAESGRRIEIAGVVTHRQRPATASGITFLNLEDETGMANVIASVGIWQRYRRIAREAPAMIVRGILERSPEGVVNVVADRFERLPIGAKHVSRDFR